MSNVKVLACSDGLQENYKWCSQFPLNSVEHDFSAQFFIFIACSLIPIKINFICPSCADFCCEIQSSGVKYKRHLEVNRPLALSAMTALMQHELFC